METTRQKKIGKLLQADLADVLQGAVRRNGIRNLIISVSKVVVTTDLSIARVYLSIFPNDKRDDTMKGIKENQPLIKHELAQRTKHQLRKMPELKFFVDDSLDYIEAIDEALKGNENPVANPELLIKRKKK